MSTQHPDMILFPLACEILALMLAFGITTACQDKAPADTRAPINPGDIHLDLEVMCLDGVKWYVYGSENGHKNREMHPAISRGGYPVPCDTATPPRTP